MEEYQVSLRNRVVQKGAGANVWEGSQQPPVIEGGCRMLTLGFLLLQGISM